MRSKPSPLIIFYNIALWIFFAATMAFFYLAAVLIFIFTFPFDPNRRLLHQYSCWWGAFYVHCNPYWFITRAGLENVDPTKAYVIVANHQSMADIVVLYYSYIHFKWVSKDVIFKVPFLGWNMSLNGYVPIKRGDPASREIMLNKCRAWLRKGSSVLFFPEGTRSRDGYLKPFKAGAFRLALEMKVDVLPIVVKGTRNALPADSWWIYNKSEMSLEVMPPVSIFPYLNLPLEEGVQKLMQDVHGIFERELTNKSA